MTKSLSFLSAVIVATALALPATTAAQATRRGGSDSGGSSSSQSGGARGGSEPSGSVAVPRNSPPPPAPSSGGDQSSRPSGTVRSPSDSRGAAGGVRSGGSGAATGRSRTTQAYRGTAQPRTVAPAPPPRPGQWDPWYSWGPRYYYGPWSYYGYWPYYGPVAYSPWVFGGAWGLYGWDPYFYDPYGYVGVSPVYWASRDDRDDRDTRELTGSLRLRVNPDHARVYVDGALAGVASEFGGLSDHLTLPEGRHQIELRADGYQVFTKDVDVKAGRTRTERVKLKKQ